MSATSKKILFVVTSHDRKGKKPSGYYLSEVTHPHQVLAGGGYEIEFLSPKGGKAPMDPDSFDLNDGVNAAFWGGPQPVSGVGFAIPVNILKMLLPRLRDAGAAPRSFLGVESQPVTPILAAAFQLASLRGALASVDARLGAMETKE